MGLSEDSFEYEDGDKFTYVKSHRKEETNFNLTCGKFRFHICPVGTSSEDSDFFIKTYFLCEKLGCLPEEGGLLDQDNRIVEAFEIISSEIARHENEELEKQKREIKQKSGKNQQGLRTPNSR